MKQKLYIFGMVTTMVIFTGTIFKVNHWPGAGILLTLGMALFVLGFLPASLLNLYSKEGSSQNKLLFFVTYLTCFVVFTAMLLKIQHWPFSGIALAIALPFPFVVFLPVFLYVTGKNKNFNIYNTVYVLFLLSLVSVFNALLSLSVTKSRIDESYSIPRNYNKLEMALEQVPVKGTGRVNVLIDDVLNVVKEYEEIILKQEDVSLQQWKNNPAILWRPEALSAAANALLEASEAPLASKLSRALTSLIEEMEKTPGYEITAKNLKVILDLGWSNGINQEWIMWYFMDNSLLWSLTYLDSIETNLLMIKISAS